MLNYKVSFYIRAGRVQEGGKVPIYYRLWVNNEKLETSTGQNIPPKYWDERKQKVVKSLEAPLINSILNGITNLLLKTITDLQLSNSEVTIENVRKLLKGEPIKATYTLIKTAEEHNISFEQQIGIQYSYGSYKNYKTTLGFLKEFVRHEYSKADIPLKQLNAKFCESYFIWLTTEKTSKQNGAGKHIQRLKKIINYAIKMGYIEVSPISGYSIKMRPVIRIALTWEEIMKISDLKFSTSLLESIKQIFIFQVFTGLAYADVKAINRTHLAKAADGRYWIRMERTKTRTTFTLPLLPVALNILMMNIDYSLPETHPIFSVVSNQKMNYNLKIIQEIAGINKSLHTHLPRHTFATTITLLQGVPIETVSKMLGHSKITMTQQYAKVGELKIAGDMFTLEEKLKTLNQ